MAQHDYVIDNSTGANVRADINSALQAIATNNSGSSAPSATFASQFFADTNAGIMKLRNTSNNGYVNLFTLAGGIDVDAASNFNEDVTFTGSSTSIVFDKSDNAFEFSDNARAKFGTGDDLQIYHNGANSYLQNSTGVLLLQSDGGVQIKDTDGNEVHLKTIDNGAVELYHDNSKKFETASSGVKVTGNILADTANTRDIGSSSVPFNDAFLNGITMLDNKQIKLGAGGGALKLEHQSSSGDSFITEVGGGNLIIQGSNIIIRDAGTAEKHIEMTQNGSVDLYHNGSKKFETDTDGGKLTGFLHAHQNASASGFTTLDRHVIQSETSNKECLVVESTASTPFGMRINFSSASPDNNSSFFLQCRDQSVDRLFIYSDGDIDNHDNSYGGMSDEKLKENIVDANSQWEDVKAIKVRNFNFKTDTPSDKRLGVVAQELETICPSLVREKSDFDENNNDLGTKTKSVKYSILYMKAFKALQEAITKIEVLEAKVAALEAS